MNTTILVTAPTESVAELLAQINVKMARDPCMEQMERVRRNAHRFGSILGIVASIVAIYDLSLLAGIIH